ASASVARGPGARPPPWPSPGLRQDERGLAPLCAGTTQERPGTWSPRCAATTRQAPTTSVRRCLSGATVSSWLHPASWPSLPLSVVGGRDGEPRNALPAEVPLGEGHHRADRGELHHTPCAIRVANQVVTTTPRMHLSTRRLGDRAPGCE